ncbi:MAG: ATP-binding protein, partial [Pseudomonadota bacterium]|nr:ATP-binding protein [Pseudomonadota bacterium]
MSGVGTLAEPITFSEFTELMRPLEPFETTPNIAVACSGGPDSMALLVLARGWVKLAGGKLTALIVDHRLRDESTAEADNVARRARELGVEAVILAWSGERPSANVQEKARDARYRLLFEWC